MFKVVVFVYKQKERKMKKIKYVGTENVAMVYHLPNYHFEDELNLR